MKLTTIQLYDETKKKLENKKIHPRESYDEVIKRVLGHETLPSMNEMFTKGDKLKQKKAYSDKEVISISHALRGRHG